MIPKRGLHQPPDEPVPEIRRNLQARRLDYKELTFVVNKIPAVLNVEVRVDNDGKRFINEDFLRSAIANTLRIKPGIISIFYYTGDKYHGLKDKFYEVDTAGKLVIIGDEPTLFITFCDVNQQLSIREIEHGKDPRMNFGMD